jgi:uroporphyrinogen decarboxylase
MTSLFKPARFGILVSGATESISTTSRNTKSDMKSRLSRYTAQHPPDPDFDRLRTALLRQGEPDRLPLFEVGIDDEVISTMLGETVRNPALVGRTVLKAGKVASEDTERYVAQLARAYYLLGYDHLFLNVYPPWSSFARVGEDTALLRRAGGRAWVDEARGPISKVQDLEQFEWCGLDDVDFSPVEYAAQILPEGMKLILCTRGVMDWLMKLMGLEGLCFALADAPDSVGAIAGWVGNHVVELVRRLAGMRRVGAITIEDDMGFKTSTLISPVALRRYVLPWTKQFVAATHAQGLPLILHACGNVESIMDDLIDDVGIDAKHSFEDAIMPVAEVKARYGHRMAILGGLDMHLLASGGPEEVRTATRQVIQDCSPEGGFALGSGNTIANYVPLGNYFAMLDEARNE